MDDFSTIEGNFKRTAVRLLDHAEASGVLRLRGRKSRLEISSASPLHVERLDDNGWYDIRVRAADGRELLLHHAITLNRTVHQWSPIGDDAHTSSVFPNVVVDDLRGLSDTQQVQKISFRLRGLHNFFHYRNSESLRSYGATPEQMESLRSMRYCAEDDGPFQPCEIYVVHRFPILLNFRVADRVYQVWTGGSFSGGNWDRVDARTYPIAEIAFDQPVNIETALDRIWEWRRLFGQMAMVELPFEAISVCGTLEDRATTANLYLPNLKRRFRQVKGRYALSPRHIALNFWRDRELLGEAMRSWLERDHDRRFFRVRLDRVIERMSRRLDPGDLVDLGSAVDSLTELASYAALPSGVLEAMVNAAHAASEEAGGGIARERLSGLLGSLQRPSLATRFANLASALSPPIPTNDATLLARSATRIRNASAHGGAMNDQIQPRISPTIGALAALCVRFDLESCGFPSRSSANVRTMSKLRFDEELEELRALDTATESA